MKQLFGKTNLYRGLGLTKYQLGVDFFLTNDTERLHVAS